MLGLYNAKNNNDADSMLYIDQLMLQIIPLTAVSTSFDKLKIASCICYIVA